MKKILTEAAQIGQAASRTVVIPPPRGGGIRALSRTRCGTMPLWIGGYTMETPPPMVTRDGVVPIPATGATDAQRPHLDVLLCHRYHARDDHETARRRVPVSHGFQRCRWK